MRARELVPADDARNRGTLVNALLHHMAKPASGLPGSFRHRRRAAAGDRASAGQADQRGDCGGEGRRDASQAGRDVRGAARGEDLHRAGAWQSREGPITVNLPIARDLSGARG
jgi:hypothetical protein